MRQPKKTVSKPHWLYAFGLFLAIIMHFSSWKMKQSCTTWKAFLKIPAITPQITTQKAGLRKGTGCTILSSPPFPGPSWEIDTDSCTSLHLAHTIHMALRLLFGISLHSSYCTAHRAMSLHLLADCLRRRSSNFKHNKLFSVLTEWHKEVPKHISKALNNYIQLLKVI